MTTFDAALVTTANAENPVLGDLRVSGTEPVEVFGIDAVAQEIAVVLTWLKGEWFLDTRKGVPYLTDLHGKGVSLSVVRSVIRSQIESVPAVVRVLSLDLNLDRRTRRLSGTFRALSSEGVVTGAV